jgi:hypothetical protein
MSTSIAGRSSGGEMVGMALFKTAVIGRTVA